MIKKQCVICGKEIEVINPHYCLCSDECRKIRQEMQRHDPERRAESYRRKCEFIKQQRRMHPRVVPCRICGNPVEPEFYDGRMHRKFHHESCVLSEALQAVSEGAGFDDKRIRRANNLYGYTVKELREEMCDV